jgi:hypothetical protein
MEVLLEKELEFTLFVAVCIPVLALQVHHKFQLLCESFYTLSYF